MLLIARVVVDSQPTMEETILVGDDLMLGPPSPIIPPDIASHVLEGVDLCDGILRNLFLCKCMSYITNISCLQCNCFYCTKINHSLCLRSTDK
jgi:hypothetical protein